MRTAMEAMVVSGRDYYWTRGAGLEKLYGDDKTSTSKKEDLSTDMDGDKKTEKKCVSTSSSTSTSKPPAYPDYFEYVVSVDVRQYHNAFNHLTDMRNNYLKAHVLFAKNMKKLSDPRGEGEGGRPSMSMF